MLAVPDVQAALGASVLGTTVGDLLDGVLLAPGDTSRLDPALAGEIADPMLLLRRLGTLLGKLAGAPGAAIPIEGILTMRITRRDDGTTQVFGVNVAIDGAWELNPGGDVVVSLEEDVSWICLADRPGAGRADGRAARAPGQRPAGAAPEPGRGRAGRAIVAFERATARRRPQHRQRRGAMSSA